DATIQHAGSGQTARKGDSHRGNARSADFGAAALACRSDENTSRCLQQNDARSRVGRRSNQTRLGHGATDRRRTRVSLQRCHCPTERCDRKNEMGARELKNRVMESWSHGVMECRVEGYESTASYG